MRYRPPSTAPGGNRPSRPARVEDVWVEGLLPLPAGGGAGVEPTATVSVWKPSLEASCPHEGQNRLFSPSRSPHCRHLACAPAIGSILPCREQCQRKAIFK